MPKATSKKVDAVSGAIVFWSLAEDNRDKLIKAMQNARLMDSDLACMTPQRALQEALHRLYPHQVEPMPNQHYGVLNIVPEAVTVYASCIAVVSVRPGGTDLRIDMPKENNAGLNLYNQFKESAETKLRPKWRELRTHVATSEIRRPLVRLIERGGGFTLRDSGGIYWIPPHMVQTWKALADDMIKAGQVLHTVQTTPDERTLRALSISYGNDMETRLKEIRESTAKPETRIKKLEQLAKRIQQTEVHMNSYVNKYIAELRDDTQKEILAQSLASIPSIDTMF